MAREERRRQEAVERVLNGATPTEVAQSLRRSTRWLYKWLSRRQEASSDGWYRDRSRRPKHIPRQTPLPLQEQILAVRRELERMPYDDRGAQAVQFALFRQNIRVPIWTINRTLQRHGLVRKRERYSPQGTPYPEMGMPETPGSFHQIDLGGPRYVKTPGRFYLLNVVDRGSGCAGSRLLFSKTDDDVVAALLDIWADMALPDYAQFDNALSFQGSHRYARSMGLAIRVCLRLGVQPVFIPLGEPWRNGAVEKFNDRLQTKLMSRPMPGQPEAFRRELEAFLRWYNEEHRSGTRGGATPVSLHAELLARRPSAAELSHALRKPILPDEGAIHVIRLIRSNLKMDLFGEKFPVPAQYKYSYLRATVFPHIHQVHVYQDDRVVLTFEYAIPPTAWMHPDVLKDLLPRKP